MGIKILSRLAELLMPRQENESEEITVHSMGVLSKDSSESEITQNTTRSIVSVYKDWKLKKTKEFNEKVLWSTDIDKELEFTKNIRNEKEFINKTNKLLNVFNSIYNISELSSLNNYEQINKEFCENAYACQLLNNFQIEKLSVQEAEEMQADQTKGIIWKLIFQSIKTQDNQLDISLSQIHDYEKELEYINNGVTINRKNTYCLYVNEDFSNILQASLLVDMQGGCWEIFLMKTAPKGIFEDTPLQFPRGINFSQQWNICLSGLTQSLKYCALLYKIQSLSQESMRSDNFFMEKDMSLFFSLFYASYPGDKQDLNKKMIKAISHCHHKTWTLEFLSKCEEQLPNLKSIASTLSSNKDDVLINNYKSLNITQKSIEQWEEFLIQSQKFISQTSDLHAQINPDPEEVQIKMIEFLQEVKPENMPTHIEKGMEKENQSGKNSKDHIKNKSIKELSLLKTRGQPKRSSYKLKAQSVDYRN